MLKGIHWSACAEQISRVKPTTVKELFEIMQTYCASDRARRRKLEERNAAKKIKQAANPQPKPWQAATPQGNQPVNMIIKSEPEAPAPKPAKQSQQQAP